MEVLEPKAAEIIKRAVEAISPKWTGMFGQDPIVIITIDEVPHAVASRITAFGAGHLERAGWWEDDGQGAAVKSFEGGEKLQRVDGSEVMGFIHFHRSLMEDTVAFRSAQPDSPIAKAVEFFIEHEDEFNAFIPVVFARVGSEDYPWRALPPS